MGNDRIDPSLLPDLGDLISGCPGHKIRVNPADLPSPVPSPTSVMSDDILGEEFGGCWTVVDRGERRPLGQKRYGVVSFDHQPARQVVRPDPLRAKKGAKITTDPSAPPIVLSEGGPMTFKEACESANRMNEILEVHES